jgi:hypothetical protein
MAWPAAARPYPGEAAPLPLHVAYHTTPPPANPYSQCTELNRRGERCGGKPGLDGRCAAHKER